MAFQLDERLAQDCFHLAALPLCDVLLMNESRYPWLILVPRVPGTKELIDLTLSRQQRLWDESNLISHFLKAQYQPDKLNVAALGNVVPQLHLHHIARFTTDAAWPAPVWGKFTPAPYEAEKVDAIRTAFNEWLDQQADF